MKPEIEHKSLLDKVIKAIFIILALFGIVVTLIYIFYTSTAILSSDAVITDVIAHIQKIDKQFILSNWYYGNEFWLFSLTIPTVCLSFFIKNNFLLRQVSVLITAILFFILLYKYGKKFIGKKEGIILIIIFLTGISYSILDYFYAFNAYLTVTINSLFLVYLFYNSFENDKKNIYLLSSLVVMFLLNMGSLRYLPSVVAPVLLTEIILIVLRHKNSNIKTVIKKEKTNIIKLAIISVGIVLSYCTFLIITNIYNYIPRASSMDMNVLSGHQIINSFKAVFNCISNFFGYDNKNHYFVYFAGNQYWLKNHRNYPLISFFTLSNIIKIIMCVILIFIAPVILYKNYKKNSEKVNFLLIFNSVSWFLMIYLYTFTNSFFYHYLELKYFIFNIVMSLMIGIYFMYKYVATTRIRKIVVNIFIITYIISNLYTTVLTIKDNDSSVMAEKYELVNLLKKNNLTYGYGGFWNGLLTHYFSNYEITVAACTFYDEILPYKWYSDKRWYSQEHTGRVFLILDKKEKAYFDKYKKKYPSPDETLQCKGFTVYVYNKNPFLKSMLKGNAV